LRTPLNPILLWTNATLKEEQIAPSLKEGLEMVRRNVELEVHLIDDLLDVARITSGKVRLNLQLSDAADLFHDALTMVKADLARKQLVVVVELTATNHRVIVDPARLQQVFWNVLKNAQKFTPEGGKISIQSFNETHGKVVFEIKDNGKGIAPDVLPHIFEPFKQGPPRSEGLGLGLAISKAIMELHGGKISAASTGKGQGATFRIEIKTVQD
jgi:signal transduction histidine kinase